MPSRRISTRTPITPTTTLPDQAQATPVRPTDSATRAVASVEAEDSTAVAVVLLEVGEVRSSNSRLLAINAISKSLFFLCSLISLKTKRRPARIHSPDPFLRAGKFSRGFAKSFSPENSFGKTEPELKPRHLSEYLEGRTPKKKCSLLFGFARDRFFLKK